MKLSGPPLAAALVLLVALSPGCHTDPTGLGGAVVPAPQRVPNVEQAQDVGAAIDQNTQEALVAFDVQALLLFELPLGALPERHSEVFRGGGGCPAVDNNSDIDGDGVPNDATFTFTPSTCTVFVDSVGTFQRSGSIHIVDTVDNNVVSDSQGYQLTFAHYRVRRDDPVPGDFSVVTTNGTYNVTATPTLATLHASVAIATEERVGLEVVSATESYDWTCRFAATTPFPIDLSIPLPPGQLTMEGVASWASGGVSFTFDVSTPQPLVFVVDCPDGPEFSSGLTQAFVRTGQNAFIEIRYVGCAIPAGIALFPGV
jgi:hypothetical protein